MSKILIGISILLMTLSLVFGFLNTTRVKGLRNELLTSIAARQVSDRAREESQKKLRDRETDVSAAQNQATAAEAKVAKAETELSKAQNAKAEIETRLEASESEIAELQKRVADATIAGGPAVPGDVLPNELKTILDQTKEQLEAAEKEKSRLADELKSAQNRMAAIEQEKKRRLAGANSPGVHGTVLAVNQAYNFVVLSLGDREGVGPNSEMLVMRRGALIGKIRISSVEPTTSIGDIINNSLARGVQVQPGDTVVYAGNTNL